jgi:hypothetical protein
LNAPNLKAGESFFATSAVALVSFPPDSKTSVTMGFTRANNIVIDQVWTGTGEPPGKPSSFSCE